MSIQSWPLVFRPGGARKGLGLGFNPFMGSRGPDSHFLAPLPTLRGRDAQVMANFGFATCWERHVHRNHVIGVVRLVGVDG